MAEQLASLAISVKTGDVKSAIKELDRLEKSGLRAERGTDRLTKSTKSLGSALTSLPVLISAVATSMAITKVVKYADTMTRLESQIKLVTNSTAELIETQSDLFALSQDTRQSLEATTNLYARMARATESMGTSQTDLLQATTAVNQALVISGASASEASSTITQLSQALASGVLRGEEFNSISENGSRVARALADNLGVTVGQLRAMAKEGKLTSDVVMTALIEQAGTLQSEFDQMGVTVEQSMTVADNSILRTVGSINSATNATASLASEIVNISSLLDDNQSSIVDSARLAWATTSRTIDMINVLYETVENTAQGAVYGVNIIVYGALSSITDLALTATEALNSIGLSSDKNVINNKKLADSIKNEYTTALKGASGGWKEIEEAIKKASPTIQDRIDSMIAEEKLTKKITEAKKKQADKKTKIIELTKEEKKATNDLFKIINAQTAHRIAQEEKLIEKQKEAIKNARTFINEMNKAKQGSFATTEGQAITNSLVAKWEAISEVYSKKATDETSKWSDNFTKNIGTNLESEIQSAFSNIRDFDDFAEALGSAVTSALSNATATALSESAVKAGASSIGGALLGGIGGALVGSLASSLFGGSDSKSSAELAEERFSAFMDGLDKASKALENFGNVGSSIENQINALQSEISRYQSINLQEEIFSGGKTGQKIKIDDQLFKGTASSPPIESAQKYIDTVVGGLSAELKSVVETSLADTLDISALTITQLKDLTSDIDISAMKALDTELNNIALAMKTNTSTAKDTARATDILSNAEFARYKDMSEAIDLVAKSTEDATKAMQDAQDRQSAITRQINQEKLGSLSYLSEAGKLQYANNIFQGATSQEDRISSSRSIAELSKSQTRSREEYTPIFQQYINELEKQKQEATLTDVVNAMVDVGEKIDESAETISDATKYAN